MKSVFSYLNYRTFLKDYYSHRKQQNPRFSYRLFARLAHFSSPNFLKLVMEGHRNLSQTGIDKVSKALKFSENEKDFFSTLVHFNQSETSEEKKLFFKKLSYFKEFQSIRKIDKKNYEYLSVWHHVAIRELTLLPNFREDPSWISKKLKGMVSEKEVLESLKLLKDLQFIKQSKNKRWKASTKNISTDTEISDLSISNFHHEMIRLAEKAIDEEEPEERDISSVTVAIDEKKFLEAKRRIQEFRRELNVLLSDCKKPTAVYQVNFQIFSLSEPPWKKK